MERFIVVYVESEEEYPGQAVDVIIGSLSAKGFNAAAACGNNVQEAAFRLGKMLGEKAKREREEL